MPARLSPITPASADAILVGDPRRAFLLAQELTDAPKMSHLARGLWGYVGGAPSGTPVTVQSTGIGGPSAVAVITDLAKEGVESFVRLGTCFALDPELVPGTVIQVNAAKALDGASRSLSPGIDDFEPDPELNGHLAGLGTPGRISSHDLVARADPEFAGNEPKGRTGSVSREGTPGPGDAAGPILARDLQTSACFSVARRNSMKAAALLIVVEGVGTARLEDPDLEAQFMELGRSVIDRITGNR